MEDRPDLLKMSAFAAAAGVPVPTIKHYLREGLLPEPVRTSRNMAYYDASLVERVKAIKRLQQELYLPLKVIRRILDRLDDGELPAELAVEATIARVLEDLAPKEAISRRRSIASGITASELDLLTKLGIVHPVGKGDAQRFEGDDVALLEVFAQARRAGLTPEMLPPEILREYTHAVRRLVRVELQLFRRGVIPAAGRNLAQLTEAATTLSERLVVLLRRRLILPTLRSMFEPSAAAPDAPETVPSVDRSSPEGNERARSAR